MLHGPVRHTTMALPIRVQPDGPLKVFWNSLVGYHRVLNARVGWKFNSSMVRDDAKRGRWFLLCKLASS